MRHTSNIIHLIAVNCQKAKKEDEKKDEEFTCPEGQGNGNFADPATCRRFYQVSFFFFFAMKKSILIRFVDA